MNEAWEKWKEFAQKAGDFQTGIIFSILYYLIIVPVGLITSLFNDFLKVRDFPSWNKMIDNVGSIKKLKQQ